MGPILVPWTLLSEIISGEFVRKDTDYTRSNIPENTYIFREDTNPLTFRFSIAYWIGGTTCRYTRKRCCSWSSYLSNILSQNYFLAVTFHFKWFHVTINKSAPNSYYARAREWGDQCDFYGYFYRDMLLLCGEDTVLLLPSSTVVEMFSF